MTLFETAKQLNTPLPELIDQVRAYAIAAYIDSAILTVCKRHDVYMPTVKTLDKNAAKSLEPLAEQWMHNYNFHLGSRLTGAHHFEEFVHLFPEYRHQQGLREYLQSEYDLSILPIHLARGMEEAARYFLPVLGYRAKQDPYAIKTKGAALTAKAGDKKFYVATRKQKYGTYLLTLTVPWSQDPTKGTFLCPVGCRACYRGYETRNRKNIVITDTGEVLAATKIRQQTEALVKQWSPEVYDVLVSGGEPLLFPNRVWQENIIDVVKQCPHMQSFRICTGALGLGLFSRFDDEFIGILVELRNEYGIQIAINAHIAHPEQFTPEMVHTALKLKTHNIRIMPQVPLVEGVNFFNYDLPKTIALLRRMARLSTFLINEPIYKFIVDMQGSVSLLQAIRVYRFLFNRHQGESNIVRPVSFELFTASPVGNLNVSYHTLFAMTMKIDAQTQTVLYTIKHPAGGEVVWQERVLEGINDREDLLQRAIAEIPESELETNAP